MLARQRSPTVATKFKAKSPPLNRKASSPDGSASTGSRLTAFTTAIILRQWLNH